MSTKWIWRNTTQVGFGENCVRDHLKDFVKPKSKVLCTFGGGSIEKNGCKADVVEALKALECEVRWEGGIPPNPEYARCCEIIKVVREWKPDLLLAVGGGSVLDGTKFIAAAAALPETTDPWDVVAKQVYPKECTKIGAVMTLPATGSEWNNNFVMSKRATHEKLAGANICTFPLFSLLDPKYTMTLPARQLRNGLYDAMCHCIDQFLTPQVNPMMDNFWMSVMRELVDIGVPLLQPNSSLELHGRLIQAATFALNLVFTLGKEGCWGIHTIGHQLTTKYGIDHGATLAMVTPFYLEQFFNERKYLMARCAERVFDVREGSDDEKARAFIAKLRQWILDIGHSPKVSTWEGGVKIAAGDVEEVTKMVMGSTGGHPFGFRGTVTEPIVKEILSKVIV